MAAQGLQMAKSLLPRVSGGMVPIMGHPQVHAHLISPEDYLARERMATRRHEYLNGMVYAMAGASAGHNRITANLGGELRLHLRGKPGEAFTSDMRVRIRSENAEFYYYPDVVVDCSGTADSSLYPEKPTVIFEVMSPETERVDRNEKFYHYQKIASLQTYVLVDQFQVAMTVHRREADGWGSEILTAGDTLRLDCIACRFPIADAYERTRLV